MSGKGPDVPLAALKSTDGAERWAAVMALRQWKIQALRELFQLLRDADDDVLGEARSVLTSMGRRPDLGPKMLGKPGCYIPDELFVLLDDQNAQAREEAWKTLTAISGVSRKSDWIAADKRVSSDAISRACAWWSETKEQRAVVLLRQAQVLLKKGLRDAAVDRLRKIIETLPGTPSADQARLLLSQTP